MLILDITSFGSHSIDPAAAFLHRLTEKQDLLEAEFLVDTYNYLTALSRSGLSGHPDYIVGTTSKSGSIPSKCGPTASITLRWAVD